MTCSTQNRIFENVEKHFMFVLQCGTLLQNMMCADTNTRLEGYAELH